MRRYLADMAVSTLALTVSAMVITALPVDVPGAGFASLADMSSPVFFPFLAAIHVFHGVDHWHPVSARDL